MAEKKINVAIIGLGFGAEFIPIYQNHPHTHMAAICQRNKDRLNEVGDAFGVDKRYTSYEDVLKDPSIDAVHINTPIHEHARMSIAGLKAGKHVACTVPAATSIEELEQIVQAQKESGTKYMMMETVIYSRDPVRQRHTRRATGAHQYLRATTSRECSAGRATGTAAHAHATHVVSPCLALPRLDAEA